MIKKRKLDNMLITGGAGFIGTNLIRFLLLHTDFKGRIINLDKLTYAGNRENLMEFEAAEWGDRYTFIQGDICDRALVERILHEYEIDSILNLAAESHVDRSIEAPGDFLTTNIMGTFNLLESARRAWQGRRDVLFHHVSTDEVYGSLGNTGLFSETSPYAPRSPYSASKASSDHLVFSYYHTYGLPVTLSNCSNNYGPFQFPEKLIPVMIEKMIDEESLPVYGDGKNIRDWLYVVDHNSAVWEIMKRGNIGECYNIGGENEWENIKLVETMCELIAGEMGKEKNYYKKLITFVKDRPGHDRRYAIDCNKLKNELGWRQSVSFEEGLKATIQWYLSNSEWSDKIKSGEYREWMDKNYAKR